MGDNSMKYIAFAGIVTALIIANEEIIRKKLKGLIGWLKEKMSKEKVYVPNDIRENPENDIEVEGMEALLCPISHELMRNPVITPYGHCFEKSQIEAWLDLHNYCPLTRQKLTKKQLRPCYTLKYAVEQYIRLQEKLNLNNN
ncbi:unnamed protein product [Blepharisma stoltei]|uniref:U-box domain-containing protein n=1 Tax=Blepharisma stoltei TaxID=1481888 RepID=A0AAU9J4F9_9CILI|nr:unnamed protein product [Blepharisma stoltei]